MTMFEAAIDLLTKREFSVIPVGQDKKPLIAWQKYQKRLPTEDEITEWWKKWPNANPAIVTGTVSGIVVIDADGEAGRAFVAAHCPATSVYVRTAKGWHFYYRHPGHGEVHNAVRFAPEVDVRGDGGYVVAPPSVHASGAVYEWLFAPGLGWGDLAMYQAPRVNGSQAALPGGGFDLSAVKAALDTSPVLRGQRNDTLARLVGKWITDGMDASSVWLMALGWNSRLPEPLPEAEVRTTVASIWKTNARNHPERIETPATENGAPLLDVAKEKKLITIPEACLNPGGILSASMEYMTQTTAVSNPVYNLAGAVALMGTLAGQKVMTETGLRTNMYCIAVGVSGTGKDAPQSAIPNILLPTRGNTLLGPNAIASDSAILTYLEKNPCTVMLLDEIGLLLQAIKSPNSFRREIPALLMQLFSGTGRPYAKSYADDKNNIVLPWHHLSLYGASTPDRFWGSFGSGEASDGFLARVLVFESDAEPTPPRECITSFEPPAELVETINALVDFNVPAASTANLTGRPSPVRVVKTRAAARRFADWACAYNDLRRACCRTDEFRASIYGRVAEHAHKLALIHAVSLKGAAAVSEGVTTKSVDWACALMDAISASIITQAQDNIAESEFERYSQRVIRTIKTHLLSRQGKGKPGVSRAVIEGKLSGISSDIVEKVLKKLEAQGVLVKKTWQGKAGPASILYCLAAQPEEGEE